MVHVQKISGLRKLEDDSIWKSLYVITKKNKPPHPETTAQFIQKKKKDKAGTAAMQVSSVSHH